VVRVQADCGADQWLFNVNCVGSVARCLGKVQKQAMAIALG
jgi:hypothetical protein